MKILFVGHLAEGQTSLMRKQALERLGHEVIAVDAWERWSSLGQLHRKCERFIAMGPTITKLNEDIILAAKLGKPQMMWAEKQFYIFPETLKILSSMGIYLLHFTPDPYFSVSWNRTRHSDACLSLFDSMVICKSYELEHYKAVSKNVIYMPLGYDPVSHRPTLLSKSPGEENKYASDVAFIGAWEPRRQRYLDLVAEAGYVVKIWGHGWDHIKDGRRSLRRYLRVKRLSGMNNCRIEIDKVLGGSVLGDEIYGEKYAAAITGAKINVGFLRNICPDQHTTRSFEIPACGSMLLADRTAEHQEFFKEGVEAEFFSSEEEYMEKVEFYLSNENERLRIAEAGYARFISSGYSYDDIMKLVLSQIEIDW